MAAEMIVLASREEWLKNRTRIGGSEASAVVGLNPYCSNVQLWEQKTGLVIPEDISDKPYIQYGQQAGMHLRGLFRLDFPEYRVEYVENNMWLNKKYPWGHYSADGMAYKTMLRQLISKWGIMSIDLQSAFEHDMTFTDETGNVQHVEPNDDVIIIEPEDVPEEKIESSDPSETKQPEPSTAASAAAALFGK